MKKLLMFVVVMLAASTLARAQDSYPKSEVFGGYCYVNAEGSLNGFGVSVAGNFHKNIGIVAEFGGHYGSSRFEIDEFSLEGDTDVYSYVFGPRFSYRAKSATVFAHALFGGARVSFDINATIPGGTIRASGSDTGFAMAIGGGIDVNAGKRVAFRAVQADYAPTRFSGIWDHNLRLQVGIVFKIGGD